MGIPANSLTDSALDQPCVPIATNYQVDDEQRMDSGSCYVKIK